MSLMGLVTKIEKSAELISVRPRLSSQGPTFFAPASARAAFIASCLVEER
jgi:hypothetical protein